MGHHSSADFLRYRSVAGLVWGRFLSGMTWNALHLKCQGKPGDALEERRGSSGDSETVAQTVTSGWKSGLRGTCWWAQSGWGAVGGRRKRLVGLTGTPKPPPPPEV